MVWKQNNEWGGAFRIGGCYPYSNVQLINVLSKYKTNKPDKTKQNKTIFHTKQELKDKNKNKTILSIVNK